ncbi:unnamed protein product [Ilex paraguariensis]|uniref:RWP-RK domain-containing protein n=1 Tax=Ilex paraguariensis TaxID=185542 RepID=A0ABC8V415_9AQUA
MEAQPELVNQAEAESKAARLTKTPLAAQRERTGKLTLKDVRQYFNLPIDDAAKKMNICPTVMKKICRRDGLLHKSIEKKISKKKGSLAAIDVKERAGTQADIESLQQELASIFVGYSG